MLWELKFMLKYFCNEISDVFSIDFVSLKLHAHKVYLVLQLVKCIYILFVDWQIHYASSWECCFSVDYHSDWLIPFLLHRVVFSFGRLVIYLAFVAC